MSVYKIRNDIYNIVNGYDERVLDENGEIIQAEQLALLSELAISLEDIAEDVACQLKNYEYDITSFKAEEDALSERRKALERKRERNKELLLEIMVILGKDKLNALRADIKVNKSKKVVIEDEEKLADIWKRIKITFEPDKKLIKKALSEGEIVSGARLEESRSVTVK